MAIRCTADIDIQSRQFSFIYRIVVRNAQQKKALLYTEYKALGHFRTQNFLLQIELKHQLPKSVPCARNECRHGAGDVSPRRKMPCRAYPAKPAKALQSLLSTKEVYTEIEFF